MDELKYQVDLLSAMNEKLRRDEKMLRLICDTSNSAFLYYSYAEDRYQTVANWDHFFPFAVASAHDLNRLYDCVENRARYRSGKCFLSRSRICRARRSKSR